MKRRLPELEISLPLNVLCPHGCCMELHTVGIQVYASRGANLASVLSEQPMHALLTGIQRNYGTARSRGLEAKKAFAEE